MSSSLLTAIFKDLIAAEFSHEEERLRIIYDRKYETRHNSGLDSLLDDERLEDEWRFKYIGLCKRRNWLWYLACSKHFIELDDYFNTDYTFSDLDLRLRVSYDEHMKQEKNRYRYINREHNYVNFSVSNLDVEEHDLDNTDVLDYNLYLPYSKRTQKNITKSYESLVDNNKVYNKCEIDNRDYNKLYILSLRLYSYILYLRTLRLPHRIHKIFRRSKSLEEFEMQSLNYQGGKSAPFIKKGVNPVRDLIKGDNRPLCCNYCPQISCVKCFKGEGCCMCISYQGNVEQDVGGDTSVVQTVKANNVVLTETEITQQQTTSRENHGWSKFVSSDVVSRMDNLVDRWFRVGTFVWTTQQPRNTTIISLDLPRRAILQDGSTCDQPNKIPFRIHRYWRGDMVVKIHINCNKFQIGQLQCAWYYQPKADDSFPTKANVYTRSGTHHCVISAAPNNEVELVIPFKAFKSMYHTKSYTGDELDLPLDLGTLFISVLSPLKSVGETSPRCSFTIFVKFIKSEFTGMIAGNIDLPRESESLEYQMDAVGSLLNHVVPAVEKLLEPSRNDNNRDNPPLNMAPPYLVPTASHSWSVGTELVEPLHNLRLGGRAQTRHPDTDLDEMKLDVLKRKFMLQDVFSWSQQDNNTKLLWSLPVNPIPPKDRIYKVQNAGTNLLASYQLTPIGFLSSMYQYWRGSIEYRFDIVASQFHSGKLMLAYIPGVAENSNVTLDQARASPHIVISLDNAMTYTWRVPYIADRPWWPRRYTGESVSNNTTSPSKLFVFVLNELVMAETVSDTVEILVYMRGGEDMEFSIPVQPSIGLGYDRAFISSRNNVDVFPVSTTNEYYAGNWHSAPLVLVWRHAATSEAVGRFSEPILDRPAFYQLNSNNPTARTSTGDRLFSISFCIFLRGIGFTEFIGLPIFNPTPVSAANRQRLINMTQAAFENNYTYGPWVNNWLCNLTTTGFIPASVVTTANTFGGGKSIPWVGTTVSPTLALENLEYQGNREQDLALVDNTEPLRSTGRGQLTYGEHFSDLKDLCRRYQIYGWTTVPKAQIERVPGACSFIVPVLPQGLNLAINTPQDVNQIWNRAREGHIPLISSLYRFYRGSLRFRIVVSNANDLIMWVQHRPDRRLTRDTIIPCTQVTTAEAVFNHTYGMYMQDMNVNHVVEIEVPFYQMANFGLLQKPVVHDGPPYQDWSKFYSLGELSIGFFGNEPSENVRCTIYYTIADDCRFTTYQGVPPMIIIDDLPEFNKEELQYQGLFTNYFSKTPKEIGNEISEGVTQTLTENVQPMVHEFLEGFSSQISSTYKSVKENLMETDFMTKLTNIGSQIIHAINNPTPSTIAISIVSILITLGVITYSVYQVAHKYIIDIWNWILSKVKSKEVREDVEVGTDALFYQSTEKDNAVSGLLSLVCGGLCTLFGIKNSIKYTSTSDALFKGITNGMKMSNVCFVFFKNFMSVISDIKSLIVSYLYPGFNAAECLMEGRDIIEKWVTYSQDVLDPYISKDIKYNRELQTHLMDCYVFGKILKVKALETQYPALIQLINNVFDKLHRLYVDLVAQGLDPHIRKMPFVIYNYGVPEIGKSHLTTDLCTELCKSQDIKSETDLMCVLNATSKFWDNCDRQPCLIMDDAFNIKKGTMLEDQIAAIFNVVSPVVLVPPKAAVEDKGRAYNPEIFVLNSNTDFFKTELCVEQALWRRRDILIHSELDNEFIKEDCIHCRDKLKVNSSLPADAIQSLKDYHHLKFKYTFDVTNINCAYLPENRWLKYPELLEVLKVLFKKNREAENIKFAHRIEQCNIVTGDRESLVANVENLESLWNDAIRKRQMHVDLIKNSTFTSICTGFANSIREKWEKQKHGILKKIYDVIQPGNNKYFLKNQMCNECNRIGYQCVSCRISLKRSMEEPISIPSTSTSLTPESVDALLYDDKTHFQNDSEGVSIPSFQHDISHILSPQGREDFKKFSTIYDSQLLITFKEFLVDNNSILNVKLRRYPIYARNISVFKSVCEELANCIHDYRINKPIIHRNKFAFINPDKPSEPDCLSDFACRRNCWMSLPWMVHNTILACKQINAEIVEDWMGDVHTATPLCDTFTFNNIFSKLTQFVFDFYYNTMKPAVKTIFKFFSSFSGWILGLSFLSLLFSTAIMGMGCYEVATDINKTNINLQNTGKKIEPIPAVCYQSKSYDTPNKVAKSSKPKPKTPVRQSKDLQYQGSQQIDIVESRISENMVSIIAVFCDDDDNIRIVKNYGVMLRDQQMLIQKHYYDYWKKLDVTTKFYFNSPRIKGPEPGLLINNFFDCDVDWFYTQDSECIDSNFGILYLPKIVPAFKNITKFIAKSTDHEYIKSDECRLVSSLNGKSMPCVVNYEINKSVTDNNGWLRLDQCYSYRYTGVGMCGSVLLCGNLERPIIGIHFAGTSHLGYAEPIVAESFVDIPVRHYDYEMCDLLLDGDKEKIMFDTLLYPQGTVNNAYAHHQGNVSQYIPSLIHGIVEVDTEPNPLSPRDPRLPPNSFPLKDGVEHMGKPPLNIENGLLEPATEDLKQTILQYVRPVRLKIDKLSLQDAICGNVNVPGFEPLEWSTSEGFPLKSLRPSGVKGKRWLFNLEEGESGYILKGMHGELQRQLSVCDALRKKGIRVSTLFTDCLKDTCIDKEKCSIPGKTRIFSISPVQYTIAFKQYFNDFLASYQNCRIDAEHGIGLNVDSLEWTRVANYITTFSNSIVAGDYKNFGPSLMLTCVEKAFDIIMAWYERYDNDPERQLVRRVLLSELLHARHLCTNVVYGVPCGIPSGSPITTPLNSLVNSLYLRCAWLDITKTNFSTMHENIKILTYGDDVCINVSKAYIGIYNTISLSMFFKKYNIIFTDIDKSDNIIPYRCLENVTFLKRGFKKHPLSNIIFLAPIDEQSIRKCISWITRKGDPTANTLENCKQACELAFGHGPEYYNNIRELLSAECVKRLNRTFAVPSWYERSQIWYDI